MENTCIIVFSHADKPEKEEILFRSLMSLKKIGLKIILASHISVSERNQNISNYIIKDDNNLILTESDIFSNPVDIITENIYNTTDIFGSLKFHTAIYKKTYQAGVFNLYISSFRLAKSLGFKNALLWEYDYELGENSMNFINESLDKINNLDSISFESWITLYGRRVEGSINCCFAVPVFFNLESITSILPQRFLENAKDYNSVSQMMIMEQWIKEKVINKSQSKEIYSFSRFSELLPDTISGQVHAQTENYLLLLLRSGLYINSDKNSACCLFANMSNENLTIDFSIKNNDSIIFSNKLDLTPKFWSYRFLDQSVFDLVNTEKGCKVIEHIHNNNTNESDTFEYIVNSGNLDFISKLKKFSNCENL